MEKLNTKSNSKTNLTSQTLHGIKWTYLAAIINAMFQILLSAIMARLLEPKIFGLVALAGVVVNFGNKFAQMGIGPALIQKKDISEENIRAAFTFSCILGLLFFVLTWIFSPFTIYLFNNQEVISVIKVMAFTFILNGFTITSTSLLKRNLRFQILSIIKLSSYILGYGVVGIGLAYTGFGVWSLVIANMIQLTTIMLCSYFFTRHSCCFIYQWKYFKEVYSFGWRISIIRFLEFSTENIDTILIGKFSSANLLGIYNRAQMLIKLPINYFSDSLNIVLFPSFSRVQSEVERLRKAYLTSKMISMSFLIPTSIGIAAASKEIVLVVLGVKWIETIPLLSILAIAMGIDYITKLSGIVCEATSKLNIKIIIQVSYIIVLSILFYFSIDFGIIGFAAAVSLGMLLRHIVYLIIVKRMLNIKMLDLYRIYIGPFVTGLIVGALIYGISIFAENNNISAIYAFTFEFFVGLIFLFLMMLFGPLRNTLKELNRILKVSDMDKKSIVIKKWLEFSEKIISR